MNIELNERNDKTLRRLGIAMLVITVALIAAVILSLVLSGGSLELNTNVPGGTGIITPDCEGVVELRYDDSGKVFVDAVGRGMVFLDTEEGYVYAYKVLPGNILYDMVNGNFSGYMGISLSVQIYLLWLTILLAVSFVIRCRRELFSYTTLYFGGITLFMGGLSIDMLISVYMLFSDDEIYNMNNVYNLLRHAGSNFMILSLPMMLIFMGALIISNIKLIRCEGRGFVNSLGFILAFCIFAGYGVYFLLFWRDMISGSEFQVRVILTVISVYTTTFVYFETMLLSSMLCGLIAARRDRRKDMTHIIILGCQVGEDGKPLPLLRHRVDRAVEYARAQEKRSGKRIKFVPSGGKGDNEPVSEAECMRDYLISQGVSPEDIITENRSVSTMENMRFSRKLIEQDCSDPKVIFSTSGYHVLRSGIIARNAGLDSESVGCRTKWYFWPNAFVREFIGLLASKWRRNIFWVGFFVAAFAVICMAVPM